ncbi:hypothetical protein Tdes44962_MAKER05969 [Teratosphaeria destructans]|uniref:DUF1989 domain-containing protein n=1 Tax=Teratosphaeria destructans TaxID=418781 RepID=A0A9W7SIN4_9PEZI|nr:hypothetical protein Tdes44962_MAKER05969 [Teratosphaeria destructans]
MAEQQTIQARHGVATFVPAGQIIKIINSSGTQVVDTWAFALPDPVPKKDDPGDKKEETRDEQKRHETTPAKATPKKKKDAGLPSQEDAEKATQEGLKQGEQAGADAKNATQQKSTWSSYVPSLGLTSSSKKETDAPKKDETEQQKNSRTWASYFPSGKGFQSYIPKSASDTVSAFAKDASAIHQRDTSKSYFEQLQDFSKTPVGAAGLSALTGSGYSSSLYAGYQAYNAANAKDAPAMEFMSMPHCRAATLHMRPKVDDVLVSNLREPMLTLVEDTSPGIHDTLIAACDPARYRGLGVEEWMEHGSCAENLVLALKELNERVRADVTINNVPAPLNLFMNIPWDDEGDLGFKAPKNKAGDYVRLKAERDVVVVMSSCPQDILDINNKKPTDAHFIVEDDDTKSAIKRSQPAAKKRAAPKKLSSQQKPAAASNNGGEDTNAGAAQKKPAPQKRTAPAQLKPTPAPATNGTSSSAAPRKKPVPQPVRPSKKAAAPAAKDDEGGDGEGSPAPPAPAEKKKPRKLASRAKPAAAAGGGGQ